MLCTPGLLNGAELKPETVDAFDQYVRTSELRMNDELKSGRSFLWVDNLSPADRAAAYGRLRNGEILVHPLGASLDIPGGMIHDWIGAVFIPNVTLDEAVAQIQNYDSYAQVYSPDVARSEILNRDGDDFKVSLWLQKKSLVTVVLNVVENVEYFRLDTSREYSCAHSTRIVEVKDSGTAPEADDLSAGSQGYLWKLDGYTWFLQTPAGVYVQIEAIALSRNIPWGLEWLIKPFVTRVPRDSLIIALARARASLKTAARQLDFRPSTPGDRKIGTVVRGKSGT